MPPRNDPQNADYVGYSEGDRAEIGILRTRVGGIERDINDLSDTFQRQMKDVTTAISSLGTKLEERGRPQWTIMLMTAGFGLAFMSTIGALAYAPIRAQGDRLNMDLRLLQREAITRQELDVRSQRSLLEASRQREDIKAIEKAMVPRLEHEEKWRGNERQLESVQRQIDDLKKFNTDLVSARDFIKNLDDKMRALERRPERP